MHVVPGTASNRLTGTPKSNKFAATSTALVPDISAPVSATVTNKYPTAIPGISVAEPGAAGVTGSGTFEADVIGSLAQVNADLVTLALTEDMVGSDKLQIGVTDSLGNFVSSSVAITSITPVLSIAASTSATVMAGVSTAVPGINLSEPGAVVGETFTVNFGVTKGVLDITSPGVAGSGTFE